MEKIDGRDCWKVDITNTGDCIAKHYEIWLDPALGFCPRKISMRGVDDTRGEFHTVIDSKDYREAADGVWFPTRQIIQETTRKAGTVKTRRNVLSAEQLHGGGMERTTPPRASNTAGSSTEKPVMRGGS